MVRKIVTAKNLDEVKDDVRELLNEGFVAEKATVYYDLNRKTPQKTYLDYPLSVVGKLHADIVEVRLNQLAVGYTGENSLAMCEVLEMFGFTIKKEDILTRRCEHRGIIFKTYSK